VSIHPPMTAAEAADRVAIRELVDAYAHCADRRDATGQMALFTEDTHFVVHMDARDPEPTQDLHGRAALAPVFDALNAYAATMHFNGQSTVELDGDRATGESYCLAHHLTEAGDGSRTLMVASIRYLDMFPSRTGRGCSPNDGLLVDVCRRRNRRPSSGRSPTGSARSSSWSPEAVPMRRSPLP
jgi:ketosteroid isomerase-like protein